MAASQSFKSAYPLSIGSFKVTMYSAFQASLIMTVVLTPATRRMDRRESRDETRPDDYVDVSASTGDPGLIPA